MGQAVAASLRAVPSKSFDYVVETSYVYARDELIHDAYAKGSTISLVCDALDGWALEGSHRKPAGSASEAHQHFEAGRAVCYSPPAAGDSIDPHTLTAFIVTVWQFLPAISSGEDAQVVRAQIRFVNSPCTERLAMDPGLLRIREGTSLNHSLLTFAASIQVCSVHAVVLHCSVAPEADTKWSATFRSCVPRARGHVWTPVSQFSQSFWPTAWGEMPILYSLVRLHRASHPSRRRS
jgi:hypothetical protein